MTTVSVATLCGIVFSMLCGIAVPLCLLLYFRKKGGTMRAWLVGCAVMLLFALVLEQFAHKLVFSTAFGADILASIWKKAVYGGFMAGLFEESGRFIAMKSILKKDRGDDVNALMFGAGHGGFEMFFIGTIGMVNYFIYALTIRAGQSATLTASLTGDSLAAMNAVIAQLTQGSPALYLLAVVERLAAICAQLSLSVLVWFAAKRGGKRFWLYPLAIALHMGLDTSSVMLNSVLPTWATELCVVAMAAVCVFAAVRVWKKNAVKEESPAAEEA